MSIVISIGNTNITQLDINDGEDVCIVVSVNPEKEKQAITHCKRTVYFKYNTNFPFSINYKEPQKAGSDRVAFAVLAYYEGITPSFLIDAGTFITFDFFDGKTLYPIATIPGFYTQLKTLKNAYNLRNLNPVKPEGVYPKNPEESLYKGIWENTLLGIKGILKDRVEILITGGDAETVKSFLKKGVVIKNAVLLGAYMAYKHRLI